MRRYPKNHLIRPKSSKEARQSKGPDGHFSGDFEQDYQAMQEILANTSDMKSNILHTADHRQIGLFYYPDLVNKDLLSKSIVKPLQEMTGPISPDIITQQIIGVPETTTTGELLQAANAMSDGAVVLLLAGEPNVILAHVIQVEHRAVERSQSEDVIIGPHQSFTESLAQNTGLIRRILATPKLKIRSTEIGRLSRTKVVVLYLEGVTQEKLVEEAMVRLNRVDIDYAEGAAYLTDFLMDAPTSIFPLLRVTERPTRVAAALIEGRIAILAQGDPTALIAPTFLPEYLQSSEDYFDRPLVGTFLRWIRALSALLTVLLPGTWIALTVFHHGIIPRPLFNSIVAGREGVPLPSVLEAFVLLLAFDIVIEASTRLPNAVGQAIGIVGAIILGQSAVQASLVSPSMIIVVALSGLATYTIPSPSLIGPLRLMKYLMLVLSSIFGIFGVIWGIIFLAIEITSLRSFGYPFVYPIAPFNFAGMLEIVTRLPNYMLTRRPLILAAENNHRVAEGLKPAPGKGQQDEQ